MNSANPPPPRTPRVLVTAGPTHEPIDSVRYIANRSSGRMGIAIAEAAAARGWTTTLLLGPTSLKPSESSPIRTVRFQSAADLERLLGQSWPNHDVLFVAAAVADYTPIADGAPGGSGKGKLRRESSEITLKLRPTPDLLAGLAASTSRDQVVVGFALEPAERLMESAREKLVRKRLHAIVANPLETMDSPIVTGQVIFSDGRVLAAPPSSPKEDFATWLLDALASQIAAAVSSPGARSGRSI